MRIDVATDTYEPDVNGVALTLERLVRGLRTRGHLVHVLRASGRDGASVPGETAMPSLSLPMYHEVKIGLPSAERFRSRWMKKRPDVVYVATESPMGASAVKAARALEIPVVMGFHTNFHQYMKDYHFSRLETAAVNYLRKLHNRAGMTVVPTEEMRRALEGLGFERLSVMGRGVDAALFDPARRDAGLRQSWGAWRDEVVFGVVGRLAREKNLVTALGLYTRLQREFPACGMKMVVVGDGPMMSSLRSEFPDAVFCGMRSGEDLARHYAAMDVLLFASETETFGNVLLEGMASGLATVSYRYAASADVVLDGINGLPGGEGGRGGFLLRHAPSAGGQGDRSGDSANRPAGPCAPERGIPSMTGLKNCWPPWRGRRMEPATPAPRGMRCWNAARSFCQTSIWARRIARRTNAGGS